MKKKCRVVSELYRVSEWPDFEMDSVLFSPRVSLAEADGLLAIYDPTDELLRFAGPKLWFTVEPMCHSYFHTHPIGKRLAKTLAVDEWVHFANPIEKYRVPAVTARDFTKAIRVDHQKKALATVNYCGGRFWWLKRHIWLRNRMVTSPLVELYGNEANWRQFSEFPRIWKKGLPSNFCGAKAPGAGLHDPVFHQFLSGYKVYVCLENSSEPYWFTEKMVNAARAGCIPIYHAHPTVRATFLKGARWVDPQDFSFNPRRTIEHALAQDIDEFRRANDAWLDSGILEETTQNKINERLLKLMVDKLTPAKN